MAKNPTVHSGDEMIPTRQSLLSRLKNWDDEKSWKDFFDTYWRLIYRSAIKAGLNDAEAQDVVQETVVSVLKNINNFRYDAQKGSFKSWLLRLTGWRVVDQFRKRQKNVERDHETATGTTRIELVADPSGLRLDAIWDEEWERNIVAAAVERVKRMVDPEQYQIFDLYVMKEWSVSKVVRTLNVNPGRVYLAKHRINSLIKKEIRHLQESPQYP